VPEIIFYFGGKHLWLDKVDVLRQLEAYIDDVAAAERYFEKDGVVRRDEIEKLPDGFN
jgi:hypothetical protein